MNKALLDTDIFSEFLKGHDLKVQQNAAAYRQAIGPLTISVVTVMEIIKGLHKMHREPEIQALLARLAAEEVLGFDIDAAEKAGRIHADLDAQASPSGGLTRSSLPLPCGTAWSSSRVIPPTTSESGYSAIRSS